MQHVINQIESQFPDNISLLTLYKEEKAAASFPSEDYIPFKQWKEEYKQEWMMSHVDSKMLSVEDAVTETEKEIVEFIAQQEKITEQKKVRKIKDTKPKVETVKVQKEKKVSKSQIAEEIYISMIVDGQHPARKDVITRFMAELDMTQAGASTYHYNIKKKLSK